MTVEGVTELRGKVVERSGGMIALEASRANTVNSRAVQRFGYGAVVRVPVQDVEVRETDRGRTTLLIVGLVGAALLLVLAATYDSEPSPPAPKQQESTKY